MYRWDEQTQGIRYFPDEGGLGETDEERRKLDKYRSAGLNPPSSRSASIAPGYTPPTPEPEAEARFQPDPVLDWGDYKTINIGGNEHLYDDLASGSDRIGSKVMTLPSAPTAKPSLSQEIAEREGALGRPLTEYERSRMVLGFTEPGAPQGRDLRMSDSEAGNLAARREEFEYTKESGRERLAFDREKEANDQEYQNAQIELSRATQEFNKAKEAASQKQNEITNEINRAKLAQDDRAQQALEAYRDQQLALDRQRIDQAERQMAESARQFAVADARMRRQQALAEAEAGQRAEGDYIKAFGYNPAYAGMAPGFGRITPEDVTRMTQPAYRG